MSWARGSHVLELCQDLYLHCSVKQSSSPLPIFIILDMDCILARMPLKVPIMLVTSTSFRPDPLAMRRPPGRCLHACPLTAQSSSRRCMQPVAHHK